LVQPAESVDDVVPVVRRLLEHPLGPLSARG
jgi:hypothetical protein